jgi:hypothetical protein
MAKTKTKKLLLVLDELQELNDNLRHEASLNREVPLQPGEVDVPIQPARCPSDRRGYPTHKEAVSVAKRQKQRGGSLHFVATAYPCPICGQWHTGRQPV